MRGIPPWLIAMFVGLFAAAAAGGLGAGAFVALLAAVVAGLVALRSLRDPPWTASGRRRWRLDLQRWRGLLVGLGRRAGAGRSAPFGSGGSADRWRPSPPSEPPEAAPGARLSVRCEVANERLQVWHSTSTRRAYEVPAERGLPQAYPGAVGDLVFERGRPRVVPRDVN